MDRREAMIEAIERDARETAFCTGRESLAPPVLAALRNVSRDAFVREADVAAAWHNRPLQIGHSQTISQPFVVALMSDRLDLAPTDRVLEVGTGSGYQAAVLAELAGEVFSIEVVDALAERSRRVLAEQGYGRVHLRVGDGALGWPEEAPFDAIIVTAAAPDIPPALVEQLGAGGRMVIPVGPPGGAQSLELLRKDAAGEVTRKTLLAVAFVPLTRRRHEGQRTFPGDGRTA